MAILSTLRYDRDLPVYLKNPTANNLSAATHSEEDVADSTQTTSMLHSHGVALPLGTLFSNDDYNQTHPSPSGGHGYMPAPTDGGAVWFCSDCGDGPIGLWQICCTACSHQRCAGCVVEPTK
jgi:streptogramin lyase